MEIRQYRARIVAENWNNDRLCAEIRTAREFRLRDADRIVVLVYRELLGRAPEGPGAEIVRRQLMDHGGTEQRLRESIRNSDEYRQLQKRTPRNR